VGIKAPYFINHVGIRARYKVSLFIFAKNRTKMALTAEDVKKIAYLARLGIDQRDIESYAHDLSGLLELMKQMGETSTDGVLPMAHPMDQAQRLRVDEVTEVDNRDNFQAIAPQVEAGLYLVPKVIE
jgi:aspartyl-tRNA(Asn)/glutamyl-tRNA(Gln) amidotransferase subunit C